MTNKKMTQMHNKAMHRSEALQRSQRRRKRARIVLPVIVALGVLALGIGIFAANRQANDPRLNLDAVKRFNVPRQAQHVEGPVNYPQKPAVGGDHAGQWQNCGFYSQPIRNENAVHSLEHGAVWIGYSPDLPEEEIDRLESLAANEDLALVSPVADMEAPVVASSWGRQLAVDSASDPRLKKFLDRFVNGPLTPEPGASCSGGVSSAG